MTSKHETFTTDEDSAALQEIDLAEMDSVSGGCRNCGCSGGATSSTNQFAAVMPLLAGRNGLRR